MPRRPLCLVVFLLLFAPPGGAEITDSGPGGFTSVNRARVEALPLQVYAQLVDSVGYWWSSDHTFSGNAINLSIDGEAGGCFCESLPNGGSVRHLEVVYADPGKALRLVGGLGPLQGSAVTGAMTWELSPDGEGTSVVLTYSVGGYLPGGLDAWAEAVDRVVGEQLERLARFAVTGRADPEAADSGAQDSAPPADPESGE